MYQDPEIAQIIRKLERKKQEAVLRMYSITFTLDLFLKACSHFLFSIVCVCEGERDRPDVYIHEKLCFKCMHVDIVAFF